jgi:hypothetical protein
MHGVHLTEGNCPDSIWTIEAARVSVIHVQRSGFRSSVTGIAAAPGTSVYASVAAGSVSLDQSVGRFAICEGDRSPGPTGNDAEPEGVAASAVLRSGEFFHFSRIKHYCPGDVHRLANGIKETEIASGGRDGELSGGIGSIASGKLRDQPRMHPVRVTGPTVSSAAMRRSAMAARPARS